MNAEATPSGGGGGGPPTVREQTLVKYALGVVARAASHVVRRFPGRGKPEALYAIGTFALYRAAREFRGEMSHDFKDHAYHRVRFAMLDSLRLERKHERRVRAAYKAADLNLMTLTDHEYNVLVHDDAEAKRRLQAAFEDLIAATFSAVVEEAHRLDVADPAAVVQEYVHAHEVLVTATGVLTEEQRTILGMVYRDDKTLDDAGKALGVSYDTAKRWHAEALALLREALGNLGVDREPLPLDVPVPVVWERDDDDDEGN